MADRTSALLTAQGYYMHDWVCNSYNYATCGGSTRPGYITAPNNTYHEVPYQWGGYRSVSQFDGDMSANKTAGDVNTSHSWQSCASGVDCSGFIQNCWGQTSQKYDDSDFITFCSEAPSEYELWEADMWRLPGTEDHGAHVRLHRGYDYNYTGAYVYESSTSYGGRVWAAYYGWSGLTDYQAWHWRGY